MKGLCLTLLLLGLAALSEATTKREKIIDLLKNLLSVDQPIEAEAKFVYRVESNPHHIGVILGRDVSKCPTASSCKHTVFVARCDPKSDSTCQASYTSTAATYDQLPTSPSGYPGYVSFNVAGGHYYVWEVFSTSDGQQHSSKQFRNEVNVPFDKSDLLEQLVKALTS